MGSTPILSIMNDLNYTSRFISLILRHDPAAAGIVLDDEGWANVDELLAGLISKGHKIDRQDLQTIVDTDTKQRYALVGDKIRANQGHSLKIDLKLPEEQPPELLYHGTAGKSLEAIQTKGLLPMDRQYVHLSADAWTAKKVGSRHGKPVILLIDAEKMHKDGLKFYRSENGVWLTAEVPVQYITVS